MAGAAAVALLTQCASIQEADSPNLVRGSFEVYASPVDGEAGTRTANDGLSTRWVAGDRFSLFHAATGASAYVPDGAFAIDDPDTGHARGTVSGLSEGTHDWYMVYPYAAEAASPEAVPVVIGSPAGGKQVQSGRDSRAHLAGDTFPVAGKALAVSDTEVPVLTAAPLLSVIAVNVTNPGLGSVKVKTVRFKAPEAIVGSFQVDVTGAAPVFRAVDATDEAVLEIPGNNRIKAGESALFFLGIKPFQASAGSTLTLTVNDETRTVTLPKATTFSAGKIKTLNITLPECPEDKPYYFKRADSVVPGHKYILVAEDSKAEGELRMALPLEADVKSGKMSAETVTEEEEGLIVLDNQESAFAFYSSENGLLIRQPDGRYVYNNNQDNVFAGTEPNVGYYWTVTFDEEGIATIQNRTRRLQYNPTTTVRMFQSRQSSSSVGANPRLYELQNDEEAAEELLRKTVPGVYAFAGSDWLYEDGLWQTSVRTLGGVVAFRLFHPSDYTVVQVTGIPAAPVVGDRFPVRLACYVKQVSTHSEEITVSVLRVEDGKAWLMGDGGTGFLVLIQ